MMGACNAFCSSVVVPCSGQRWGGSTSHVSPHRSPRFRTSNPERPLRRVKACAKAEEDSQTGTSEMSPEEDSYDVVVIGSGLGGLSTAALLSAAYDKSVCVCESHSLLGGAAHSFTRKAEDGSSAVFTFDSGPHLFSGLSSGGIGNQSRLSANPMQHVLRAVNAEVPCIGYDTWGCFFPEGYFATKVTTDSPLFSELIQDVSGESGRKQVEDLLKAMKPLCFAATALPPAALRAGDLFGSLRIASGMILRPEMMKSFSPYTMYLTKPFAPLLDKFVKDKFARNFLDLLCFLLAGVGADRIPTAEIAFMFGEWTGQTAGSEDSKTVLEHPVGGAGGIVSALVEAIERNDRSTVMTNAHVAEVMMEEQKNGHPRAVGVKLRSGRIVRARQAVVSNVSAWDLPSILPSTADGRTGSSPSSPTGEELEMCPSFMHLHVAVELTDAVRESLPHKLEPNYVFVKDWDLGIEAPQNVVLMSIPSVVDASAAPPNYVVIHAYSPATEPYEVWADVKRGTPEYDALKEKRAEFLWDALDRVVPDARRLAAVALVGTPHTHARFLRRHRGTYGPAVDAAAGALPLPLPNRFDVADGLWTVGDGTFPGIGVPAVAASAWLAANGMVDIDQHRDVLRRVGLAK